MTIPKNLQKKVFELREQGYFFREIARELNISLGSTHKYGSGFNLSDNARKILEGKTKKSRRKSIKLIEDLTLEKARIIAHCIFDGSVTKGTVRYTNSSPKLINLFVKDIKEVYGVDPDRILNEQGKHLPKITACYFFTEISDDLHRYSKSFSTALEVAEIHKKIIFGSLNFKKVFIRAFWEDEGCITIDGDIIGRIKSKKIRDQLVKLHRDTGIECTPYDCSDNCFGIYIKRSRDNINKFKKIGFEHSIIVRGKNIGMKKRDLFNRIYGHYLFD